MLRINQYIRINNKFTPSQKQSADMLSWISQLYVLFTFSLSLLPLHPLKTVDMKVVNGEKD